jgi:predicted metal-dependent hydrolase
MNIDKIPGGLNKLGTDELDPQYVGFFDCFNRQLFYEAHEVLEKLWLPQRGGVDGPFYKGLIQLAGAFVHLQKNRRQPALSLLALAEANFRLYPSIHHLLDLGTVLKLIQDWRAKVESVPPGTSLLIPDTAPRLSLAQH